MFVVDVLVLSLRGLSSWASSSGCGGGSKIGGSAALVPDGDGVFADIVFLWDLNSCDSFP